MTVGKAARAIARGEKRAVRGKTMPSPARRMAQIRRQPSPETGKD
jgi:hypothetical protein